MAQPGSATTSKVGIIRHSSRETVNLFSEARKSNTVDPRLQPAIEDAYIRFLSWAGNVGALVAGNASVDYRLRDEPMVQNLLRSMLDRLNEDLQELLRPELEAMDEEVEWEDDDNDREKEESDGEGRKQEEQKTAIENGGTGKSEENFMLDTGDNNLLYQVHGDQQQQAREEDHDDSSYTGHNEGNMGGPTTRSDLEQANRLRHPNEVAGSQIRVSSFSVPSLETERSGNSPPSSFTSSSGYVSSTSSSESGKGKFRNNTMEEVERTVDQLIRFAKILRRPASTSENARVRAFIGKQSSEDLDFLVFGEPEYGLKQIVRWKLTAKDFRRDLPEALVDRLFESYVFRKMMLLYREMHSAKLRQGTGLNSRMHWPVREAPLAAPLQPTSNAAGMENASVLEQGDMDGFHDLYDNQDQPQLQLEAVSQSEIVRNDHLSVRHSDTNASSFNQQGAYERSLIGSTMSRTGIDRRKQFNIPQYCSYPGIDFRDPMCPYCHKIISEDEMMEPRWSRHVLRDLKPYVCLFPDCMDVDPYYSTTDEWLSHMQNHACHWRCQAASPEKEENGENSQGSRCDGEFYTEDELKEHYHDSHGLGHLFSAIHITRLVESSLVRSSDTFAVLARKLNIGGDVCPMCKKPPDMDKDFVHAPKGSLSDDDNDQLAQRAQLDNCLLSHLEEFALRALPAENSGSENGIRDDRDGDTVRSSDGMSLLTKGSQAVYGLSAHGPMPLPSNDVQQSFDMDSNEDSSNKDLEEYFQNLLLVREMDGGLQDRYNELISRVSAMRNTGFADQGQDEVLQEFAKKHGVNQESSQLEVKSTNEPRSYPELARFMERMQSRPNELFHELYSETRSGTYPGSLLQVFTLNIEQLSRETRAFLYTFFSLESTSLSIAQLLRAFKGWHTRWVIYEHEVPGDQTQGDGIGATVGLVRIIHLEAYGLEEISDGLCSSQAAPPSVTSVGVQARKLVGSKNPEGSSSPEPILGFSSAGFHHRVLRELRSFSLCTWVGPSISSDSNSIEEPDDPNRRLCLGLPFLNCLLQSLSEVEREQHIERLVRFSFASLRDDVLDCIRSEGDSYRPIVNLAGGATYDFLSLVRQLDCMFYCLYPWIRKLLQNNAVEFPTNGTFASIAAMFHITWLVRDRSEKISGTGRISLTGLSDESRTGWAKLNNEIKRALLLTKPNLLDELMGMASRAPQIWREGPEKPSASEIVAKAEKTIWDCYIRWRQHSSQPQDPQELSSLWNANNPEVPMWRNIVLGAKAVQQLSARPPERSSVSIPGEDLRFSTEVLLSL